MKLAIPYIPLSLFLDGVEAVSIGVVVIVDRAVSTSGNGTRDVDGRWIEGEREVLLLCGGDSLRGDFDNLECGHGEIGGDHQTRPRMIARTGEVW